MEETAAAHYVFECVIYFDDRGRKIIEHRPASGMLPDGHAHFWGEGVLRLDTGRGIAETRYNFPLEGAVVLPDCVAMYAAQAEKWGKIRAAELQQQMIAAQSRIVTGNVIPMPDGPHRRPPFRPPTK